jgi:hypothetical protein
VHDVISMTSHAPVSGRVTKVTSGEACEDWWEFVYLFLPILFLTASWILQLIYWQNFKLLCPRSAEPAKHMLAYIFWVKCIRKLLWNEKCITLLLHTTWLPKVSFWNFQKFFNFYTARAKGWHENLLIVRKRYDLEAWPGNIHSQQVTITKWQLAKREVIFINCKENRITDNEIR